MRIRIGSPHRESMAVVDRQRPVRQASDSWLHRFLLSGKDRSQWVDSHLSIESLTSLYFKERDVCYGERSGTHGAHVQATTSLCDDLEVLTEPTLVIQRRTHGSWSRSHVDLITKQRFFCCWVVEPWLKSLIRASVIETMGLSLSLNLLLVTVGFQPLKWSSFSSRRECRL